MTETEPARRNRLDEEASPYLRQHADNPVHWQPWDETALDAARERDVPVFLSVGYSACHWCHVMAEESFEDEAIAEVLNDRFVPVKVDREERPALDRLYQTVCQLVTGRGGWPLSVFLTPDLEPFYVGTYFPREPRQGQPGFEGVLEDVAEAWDGDRESVEERATQWMDAARGELEAIPDQPDESENGDRRVDEHQSADERPDDGILLDVAEAALSSADREHGGFGRSQKFPNARRIDVLLRGAAWTDRDAFRGAALAALNAIAGGGLRDHVGGGFHRYCTDRDWTVPHFEKMLYDNAELPRVYLAGYRATGDERYADVARETFDFLDRELSHPEGGFYATLDARSPDPENPGERVEGAFYVWTPEEVQQAVGDRDLADLFCERYGVTEAGNFEGETVLTEQASPADLAADSDLSEEEIEDRLAEARERVRAARAERPRPARDEKVIAGWNGLAITALAEGGVVLGEPCAERAADALGFVRERLWDGSELARRWKDGDVKGRGSLDDYAFLGRGALDLYGATGDPEHLAFAADLGRALVERFQADGTLYFAPADDNLPARPQELGDQSTPSSAGVAAGLLLDLDAFLPERDFGAAAEDVLATHAGTVEEDPLQHVSLALAADRMTRGSLEITVAGDLPDAWRERLAGEHLPDALLAPRPADEAGLAGWLDRLNLSEAPAIWAGRTAKDGPTAYVCRRSCSPPITDGEDLLEWIGTVR
jgi:uncharacterized protein YyaL (SSP411 family)